MGLRDLLLRPEHTEYVLEPYNTVHERLELRFEQKKPVEVYGWKVLSTDGYYKNTWVSPVEGTPWDGNRLTADREPSETNVYGIYLFKTRRQAEQSRYQGAIKYIRGTGVIVEHEDGYRVQHAEIIK